MFDTKIENRNDKRNKKLYLDDCGVIINIKNIIEKNPLSKQIIINR